MGIAYMSDKAAQLVGRSWVRDLPTVLPCTAGRGSEVPRLGGREDFIILTTPRLINNAVFVICHTYILLNYFPRMDVSSKNSNSNCKITNRPTCSIGTIVYVSK